MKKATRSEKQSRQRKADSTTTAPCKIERILAYLLSGASLNRFEAERLGCHVLNTSISTLANRHGLTFRRVPEKVPNNWGKPCRVIRYSLPASEHDRAALVIAYFRRNKREG